MSVIDKVVAAVTPLASDEARQEARQKARGLARPGDWLSQILDHHVGIDAAFANVKTASSAEARRTACKELALLLTGHAQAEETVIYPALTEEGSMGSAGHAYQEQATVKVQMAMLEKLEPMSQDFLDKLEHIKGAVQQHVYREEEKLFPEMIENVTEADQALITQRYAEEFERYFGGGAEGRSAMSFSGAPTPTL